MDAMGIESRDEFRCGTQQEYIKIPLGGYLFVGSVRIAVFRNGGYYLPGFLIERAEILVVGDAYRIESLSRHSDGGDDIYSVVIDHLPVLVPAVTQLLDFVYRPKNGIQVLQEKGLSLCLGGSIRFGAVRFAGNGNP